LNNDPQFLEAVKGNPGQKGEKGEKGDSGLTEGSVGYFSQYKSKEGNNAVYIGVDSSGAGLMEINSSSGIQNFYFGRTNTDSLPLFEIKSNDGNVVIQAGIDENNKGYILVNGKSVQLVP
jgi:hypothetical protein